MSDHGIGGFPDGAGCPRCGPSIPKLIVSRIYYFLTFAVLGTFWMLLSTFSRYLGLNAFQAGIISGARPLMSGTSVAVWTHIADRFQHLKKPILLLAVTSHGLLALAFVFFRPQFSTATYLNCDGNLSAITTSSPITSYASNIPTTTPNSSLMSGFSSVLLSNNCSIANYTSELPTSNNFGSLQLTLYQTFVVILVLVLVNESVGSGITSMADVATYSHLGKENYVKFGWIRVFGAFGWALGVFSLTLASQYFRSNSNSGGRLSDSNMTGITSSKVYLTGNYTLVFASLAVILVLSFLTACLFEFHRHPVQVARGALRNTFKQVLIPRIVLLSVVIFHSGTAIGANVGFLFWLIQDLGGTQSNMGIASLISAFSDVPSYLLAPVLIRHLSAERVVAIGIVCQIIYFYGIPSFSVPWAVYFFQPFMGGMHGLLWAAVQAIFVPLSAPGTETLMIGLLHTLMYGFGAGVGSFVGGALVNAIGSRWMFRIVAIQSAVMLVLHCCSILYFGVKPMPRQDGFHQLDKFPDDNSFLTGGDEDESDLGEETSLSTKDKLPLETLKQAVSSPDEK